MWSMSRPPAWSALRSTKRLGRPPPSVAPALGRKNEYALFWWISASRSSSTAEAGMRLTG
jgi:hypothetical protein